MASDPRGAPMLRDWWWTLTTKLEDWWHRLMRETLCKWRGTTSQQPFAATVRAVFNTV